MIDDGVSLLLTEALSISQESIVIQGSNIRVPPVLDGWKRERLDLLSVVPIDH